METNDAPTRTASAVQHALRILQDEEGYANSRIDPDLYKFTQTKDSVSFSQFWVKSGAARERYEAQIDTVLAQLKSHGFDASSERVDQRKSDKYEINVTVRGLDKPETVDALEKFEAVNASRQEKLDAKQRVQNTHIVQSAITAAIGRLPKQLSLDQAQEAVNELLRLAKQKAADWNVPCPNDISSITHKGNSIINRKQEVVEI